ncbi:MAG TPA: Hsp20/alpha crystallin family protein [Euzebyales bacterium]|nr:Hsp20/alpha crystallin family protein [Euzebyales bacterium]
MAVVRWDPWAELDQLQRDVSDLFNRRLQPARTTARPAMDAFRTDEGTVVRLDVPGFAPEDVQVSVHEGVLTLSGSRTDKSEAAEGDWIRRERASYSFERSVVLPKGVDVDAISANVDKGVLEVHVPHPAEQQPRQIDVTSADASSNATVEVGEGSAEEH